jgi:hypothetical protein
MAGVCSSSHIRHEKTRMTRPCHTGACANVHPCHVPYTVCTIVGFSGDSTRTWPHHLSKSLATTLVVITTTRQRIVELFSFVVMVLYDVVTIHCVHIRVPVAKLQMCQYFCNYSCNDNLFSGPVYTAKKKIEVSKFRTFITY